MDSANNNDKHKILVVDDQLGIVSFLYDFFTHKGYEVVQATSGNSAIGVFKKEKPSLILLDLKLGWGKDGIQVLKELKELDSKVRVIMMTSISDDETIEKAFTLGAEDYIIKPFSLDYLEKVVMLKVLNIDIRSLGNDAL